MDIHSLLQANCDKILAQYQSNLHAVLELQQLFINDILPSVADELALEPDATQWAKEWLEDTSSVFQILRRNNFTRSAAMETMRKTLSWRYDRLWPPTDISISTPRVHCLPADTCDPFGRPILLIEVIAFSDGSDVYQPLVIRAIERLRLHLKDLNDTSYQSQSRPSLQYVVLLDLKDLSMKTLSIDLISWVLREVIPRFPGMLAAVFMINYSWAHSGMWSIAKRVLPEPALTRVFFPTQQELINYFTPDSLPKEYGGRLGAQSHLDEPLWSDEADPPLLQPPSRTDPKPKTIASSCASSSHAAGPSSTVLSPTSIFNPFFGYPSKTSSDGSSPLLHHGRRRKRDLLRTLVVLFWLRWRRGIKVCLWLAALMLTVKLWSIKRLSRTSRKEIDFLKAFWPSSI